MRLRASSFPLVLSALIVGTGAGLAAVAFRWLITAATWIFTGTADYSATHGNPANPWLPWLGGAFVILAPAVGGVLYGPLVDRFAREARGHGVPEVMYAVNQRGGRIAGKVALVKALASAICIGSGGSVGREGPIVQIGSALGSTVGRLMRMPEWITSFDGSRAALATLKNLTSDLIGRFARAATAATREAYDTPTLTRYRGQMVVPRVIAAEMAVLKGTIGAFVVSIEGRRSLYKEQRRVLKRLASTLWDAPEHLDTVHSADFAAADSDAARRRVVVDQVASLTDRVAISWHDRLVGETDVAGLGVWVPGARPTAPTSHSGSTRTGGVRPPSLRRTRCVAWVGPWS